MTTLQNPEFLNSGFFHLHAFKLLLTQNTIVFINSIDNFAGIF